MIWKRWVFATLAVLLLLGASKPTTKASPTTLPQKMGDARIVYLSDSSVGTIFIHPGGSVISFPSKPAKVVIGREGQFDIQYIEHDVAIVALTPASKASMFVYLLGRRYTFNLVIESGKGERIIKVRDPLDDRVEIEVK